MKKLDDKDSSDQDNDKTIINFRKWVVKFEIFTCICCQILLTIIVICVVLNMRSFIPFK